MSCTSTIALRSLRIFWNLFFSFLIPFCLLVVPVERILSLINCILEIALLRLDQGDQFRRQLDEWITYKKFVNEGKRTKPPSVRLEDLNLESVPSIHGMLHVLRWAFLKSSATCECSFSDLSRLSSFFLLISLCVCYFLSFVPCASPCLFCRISLSCSPPLVLVHGVITFLMKRCFFLGLLSFMV